MFELCAPSLIYLVFSLTQIIIDTVKGFYNTAMMKFIVMVMVTILLNILCNIGLETVAWFIVFVPFILMTIIISMLLYIFGLKATTGTLDYNFSKTNGTKKAVITTNGKNKKTTTKSPPTGSTDPEYVNKWF